MLLFCNYKCNKLQCYAYIYMLIIYSLSLSSNTSRRTRAWPAGVVFTSDDGDCVRILRPTNEGIPTALYNGWIPVSPSQFCCGMLEVRYYRRFSPSCWWIVYHQPIHKSFVWISDQTSLTRSSWAVCATSSTPTMLA